MIFAKFMSQYIRRMKTLKSPEKKLTGTIWLMIVFARMTPPLVTKARNETRVQVFS